MNEDMPWVNLTQEEVEELRNKKHELTEYGKDKIRELMNKDLTFKTNGKETFSIPSQTLENLTLGTKTTEIQLEVKEMTHEEMLEEAERREAENKALAALDELYEKHGDAMVRLAEIEKNNGNKIKEAIVSLNDTISSTILNALVLLMAHLSHQSFNRQWH